ncbi:MAG: ABC transporter permease protein amino terminal extension PA5075.N / ABC transporter, permease protein (cluster 3, basic aa/glutamine/opines) [Olavius algarvensis Delta 4 endosymbiont]|nr:MAG: ABC transporter permease protein amino terminal extension PA5075.N / ABC transporter, permease protein (cluster 3, basic aa/glutamine/opines) [Olavius algarvensis Delta 4 endosymbiont]
MESSSLQKPRTKANTIFWISVFFLGVFSMLAILYIATIKIDYVWRWYNVPRYFAHHEKVETKAEIEGTVASISADGNRTVVSVKGEDGAEVYTIEHEKVEVWVGEGDLISPGDTLAHYMEWRPGIMLQGMWITLKASLYAIVFGILIGLMGGIARLSSNPAFKWAAITYVEIIRGSPLLVQIFIWYFVFATLVNNILLHYSLREIPAIYYGVASLACFTGAYVTEIVRAGIQSIHKGQSEASRSLGMTYAQSMYHVILPQAMRRILPPLAGQFISLVKDSSLLGIIAIRELTKATREAITVSLQPYEFWFVCAIMYLVLTFALSMFVQYLERRYETS